MVHRQNALSHISRQDYCKRFSPSQISDTPGGGFETVQNQSLGFAEWTCAVLITTKPQQMKLSMKLYKSDNHYATTIQIT